MFKKILDKALYGLGFAYDWCYDHKKALIFTAPLIIGIAARGITAARVSSNRRAEKMLKENYIYDPRLRYHLKLKHRLNNKELRTLRARQRAGETTYDILSNMKVLK